MTTLLQAERVLTRRGLTHSLRDTDSMVTAVVAPVAVMLLFVTVFGSAVEGLTGGASYVDYVAPGVVLLCAGFGASMTSTAVHSDLSKGVVRRLRTMPVRASAVITGHVVAGTLRNLVSTLLVLLVAVALGFRPEASATGWLWAAALVTAYIVLLTLAAAAWGLAARSADTAGMFAFVALFVPYLSSAFVPVDGLPSFLRGFAEHQPVSLAIETLRELTSGIPVGDQATALVLWLGGLTLGALVLTRWLFHRAGRR